MESAVVILAGGKSSRMGRDKAGLRLGETDFLAGLAERYRTGFGQVWVSSPAPGTYVLPGVVELPDLRPGCGPLAGLEAAFVRTGARRIFFTAVDLPFGETALARRLLDGLGEKDACLIRRSDGRLEPLFAAYRDSCLPHIRACLDQGRRAVRALLDRLDCRMVEEKELAGFDLERVLFNVNTPEDYRRAKKF